MVLFECGEELTRWMVEVWWHGESTIKEGCDKLKEADSVGSCGIDDRSKVLMTGLTLAKWQWPHERSENEDWARRKVVSH